MALIIGLTVVMIMVFGGYFLAGGKFHIIIKALPFEMMISGGAAVGAFIISNQGPVIKKTLGDLGKLMKGSKWSKEDYSDALCLLFLLLNLIRTKGMLAIEPHIENPHESDIFNKYPKISGDHFAIDMIADTLRMVSMNLEDPGQINTMLNKQLAKHHHEAEAPSHALHVMAEGIPALGIVAAVLGVIKTMASIAEPPEVLGALIGGALVGTFLGVFLSYAVVGPMSERLHQICEEEHKLYLMLQDVLVASLQKNAPQVCIEVGRGNIPSHLQPTFAEMEEALEAAKG